MIIASTKIIIWKPHVTLQLLYSQITYIKRRLFKQEYELEVASSPYSINPYIFKKQVHFSNEGWQIQKM